jgi:hypothetical protein
MGKAVKTNTDDADTAHTRRAEIRSILKGETETQIKFFGYLLASHAGGMIACLSVLKDYEDNPQLKGIGIFVVLFGLGLIITAFALLLFMWVTEVAYFWAIRDMPQIWPMWLMYYTPDARVVSAARFSAACCNILTVFSALLFILAVGIGIYRFGGL